MANAYSLASLAPLPSVTLRLRDVSRESETGVKITTTSTTPCCLPLDIQAPHGILCAGSTAKKRTRNSTHAARLRYWAMAPFPSRVTWADGVSAGRSYNRTRRRVRALDVGSCSCIQLPRALDFSQFVDQQPAETRTPSTFTKTMGSHEGSTAVRVIPYAPGCIAHCRYIHIWTAMPALCRGSASLNGG
ncbi:hypothetical protein DM02DRAFT_251644 [Periconia macrospinosa]|uniref:Uncharacterized protein n=1 Tax=Periconia macrospinosa TaxID=97972 RepID=A0A2V1E2R5_9PLEO|nr:hypothetical protein DM02DRAFT_251644 [Periconia macrospinosa]